MGAVGQFYAASANGQYAVVLTQNTCSEISDCVTMSTVCIDEFNLENEILYPNPKNSIIHVPINPASIEHLRVSTILGEVLICTKQINALDVSQLATGL